ncbi:MAG TPA: hypothetical protein GX509_02770 [Firmicutes bacterium]|nr:hypothetical protein [Bacillota bacterium]HHY97644.1 hypothetical protein [Bacillota bacterium]
MNTSDSNPTEGNLPGGASATPEQVAAGQKVEITDPKDAEGGATLRTERKTSSEAKSSFLVFLFALIPGAGQMYLGLMNRGLQIMAFFFGALFIAGAVGRPFDQLWSVLVAPVTWFYSFFDTFQISGRLARGELVPDLGIFSQDFLSRNSNLIGWVLVALGAIGILNRISYFGPYLRSSWITAVILPIAMVILGVWLLTRERSARS